MIHWEPLWLQKQRKKRLICQIQDRKGQCAAKWPWPQYANPMDTVIALLDADAAQQAPQGIERVMLASDKLPVVLAVVLLIWFGLLFLLFRTDRRITKIESELNSTES